jgi:hypothetical protein
VCVNRAWAKTNVCSEGETKIVIGHEQRIRRAPLWLLLLLLSLLAVACQGQGAFGSNDVASDDNNPGSREAITVTFRQLDANPAVHLNRLIQVTGSLTNLPSPPCATPRGPAPQWALLEGSLRLDATGFESVMPLVPEGTTLTVAGIWRYYRGPVGCGSVLPVRNVWYLEVLRLVAPNPLPGVGPLPEATPLPGMTETPPVTATATATPGTGTPLPTLTPSITAIPTGTPELTMSPTPSATPTATETPAETPAAGTPSATPAATDTPALTPTPSATASGGSTPTLPAPTETPPGYPPPPPTETPPPY